MSSNYIKNVAIVGAGGRCGSHITTSLLATNKHTITALTRPKSTSTFPQNVIVKHIDYNDPSTLVSALKSQDALIITIDRTKHHLQKALVDAAAEANVPWILPNEWGLDTTNPSLVQDIPMIGGNVAQRKYIEDLGKSSYVAVCTGIWLEWSLGIPEAFGIDAREGRREVTIFGDGMQRVSMSTWPQVGRTVAKLLSLPITAGKEGEAVLEMYRNKVVNVSSFCLNQRDMFESVLRVTGTEEKDWTVKYEGTQERYDKAKEEFATGSIAGFGKMLYTRPFFPDGTCDTREKEINGVLGLKDEVERLDEYTKIGLERQSTEVHPWDL